MLWVGLHLCPWKKMEYSYPLLQWTRWQLIFHTVPRNWTKSVRKQGRILHSSLWCTTFWLDGLVTEGSFHKSSTCTGTTGKTYLLRMDSQPRVPDFSSLPPFRRNALEQVHEGHQGMEKCMLKARESVFWPGIRDDICMRKWKIVEFVSQLPELPSL